jgi:hypothetical protein
MQLTQASNVNTEKMYELMIKKDTSKLTQEEKLQYCASLCHSLGLNPLTQPFEFIRLNGKETPYAKKDATDQLRKLHRISLEVTSEAGSQGIYMVRAKAIDADGRTDMATGAVNVQNLKGDALCNAIMKAETKAKRRVTLSICGLGFLDESEFDTIQETKNRNASPVQQPKATVDALKWETTPDLLDDIKMHLSFMTNNFKDKDRLKGLYAFLKVQNFQELQGLSKKELVEVLDLLEYERQKDEEEEVKEFVKDDVEF